MKYKGILYTIILLLSCFPICIAIGKCGGNIVLNHSIGSNTHMGYQYYDYDYRKEMCKSIGELKIGMIRDYVYNNSLNSSKNRITIFNNVLYNLQKYAPDTQVLGVLHDRKWEIDKDVPLSKYYQLVREAVITYNGKTKFVPTDYGREMSFEIKYWEICNELDWFSYGRPPFETTKKAFDLIKNTYLTIKEANPNAKVVFPGVAHINNRFLKDLVDYTDEDGKRIWDYFDVFNFHYYPSSAEELIPALKQINDIKKKYGWNKPIWLTEVGWSEFHANEMEVAKNLPKAFLIAFAYGVEKVFMFQYRRFDYDCNVDASFGLLKSSLDATYVSLSSGEKPFSRGTGYNHVLINKSQLKVPLMYQANQNLAKQLLEKVKQKGLKIAGKDYVIDKISIKHVKEDQIKSEQVLLNQETANGIFLMPSAFKDCGINDTIVISFKEYKKNIRWEKTDKTKAYDSMYELIRQLPDGSTNFTLDVKEGIYTCRWLDNRNNSQMAIWSTKNKYVKFGVQRKVKGKGFLGDNIIIPSDGIQLNNGIIYISGKYSYFTLN